MGFRLLLDQCRGSHAGASEYASKHYCEQGGSVWGSEHVTYGRYSQKDGREREKSNVLATSNVPLLQDLLGLPYRGMVAAMTRYFPLIFSLIAAVGLFAWADNHQPAVKDEQKEEFASMRDLIGRYETDRRALERFYGWRVLSKSHYERMVAFNADWKATLAATDFDALSQEGRVDYVLMRHRLDYNSKVLATNWRKLEEVDELVGFKAEILELFEAYRQRDKMEPRAAAEKLAAISKKINELQDIVTVDDGLDVDVEAKIILAQRVQKVVVELQRRLDGWYKFYAGFDPEFSWWAKQPHTKAVEDLKAYEKKLGEIVSGGKVGDEAPLVGDPIGAKALADDLTVEMLSYSPQELLEIGEREFAWCRKEMEVAAGEMGFGKDWHKALEKVKADFVPPGAQDDLAADIAKDAMDFIDARDLVTVPDLCRETWYLTMLGKKEQETLPYAVYRGQAIGIAFPTDEMSVEKKLMSLRGNNRHFTRAVIPHELVPGHHLQRFMAQRHSAHRRAFSTPFYVEGWALHWEMLLYDLKFPRTPEERIGMLFWRAHRCARIVVSLKFHLGQMPPEEMVNFLVDEVGMEESGARSEVRRYVGDSYSPLYQCGYMIGGLQLRELYKELVTDGKMAPKEFHDRVLKMGTVPIEMVRASLLDEKLGRDWRAGWRF